MKFQANFKYFLALLLGIGLSFPAITTAMPHTAENYNVKVSIVDLDLSGERGIASLYQRIKSAARKACGGRQNLLDLTTTRLHRKCVAQAMDTAVNEVNNNQLTKLHAK